MAVPPGDPLIPGGSQRAAGLCSRNTSCALLALLVRGELFGGRVPRAEVRGQYQSLRKASEAVSNSQTSFSDATLERCVLHFRSPNRCRSARTPRANQYTSQRGKRPCVCSRLEIVGPHQTCNSHTDSLRIRCRSCDWYHKMLTLSQANQHTSQRGKRLCVCSSLEMVCGRLPPPDLQHAH